MRVAWFVIMVSGNVDKLLKIARIIAVEAGTIYSGSRVTRHLFLRRDPKEDMLCLFYSMFYPPKMMERKKPIYKTPNTRCIPRSS